MEKKTGVIVSAGIIFLFFLISYNAIAIIYPSYENESDCRSCHAKTPVYIADRHHVLTNGTYRCSDCHPMIYDEINQTYTEPEIIRNCLICHAGKNHMDIHHILAAQDLFKCQDCHPLQYNNVTQTYEPYITYECTICHSTVLSIQNESIQNETPAPTPTPTPTPTPPQPPIPPAITAFDPISPVTNIVGESRTFRIITDQVANITWDIEGNTIQINESVTDSDYTNISAAIGIWNVTASASNVNGTVKYTWLWNVSDIMPIPLEIEFYFPQSPVTDSTGSSRKFGLALNQFANVTWSVNGTEVQFNQSVNQTAYNMSAEFGTWIINAYAINNNGSVNYTWLWTVHDTVPPVTDISLSGISGNNGWNKSNVSVNLTAVDTGGSGLAGIMYMINSIWNAYTVPFEITTEGINNISYYSTDNDNNVESTKYQLVKIDRSLPQITIDIPANNTIYTINQNLIANWYCNDMISGLSSCIGTYSNGSVINTSSPGTKYFTVNATDIAGNTVTRNNIYYIKYIFGGYLQPVDDDGSSIFKLGSNVPIKFQLTDANNNWITTANVSLVVTYVSSTTGTINEPVYSGAASTGYYFTYDATGHFYMYNLGTKSGFREGKYLITSYLNDGSSYPVFVSLKR